MPLPNPRAGPLAVTWATFDLPTTLVSGGLQSQFWYGPNRNRWKQVATTANGTETTLYIAGLLEKVTKPSIVLWKHYVPTPSGTAAVYIRRSDGTADTYYLTSDHLGSTDKMILAAGGTLQVAESFGAFGARRGSNWTGVPSAADLTAIGNTTPDGFTGHEHLDNIGLIHMNGRVYDPIVGRFMSVDPIMHTGYGQDLNGYSYGWNRPLSVTDPTGWDEDEWVRVDLPGFDVTGERDECSGSVAASLCLNVNGAREIIRLNFGGGGGGGRNSSEPPTQSQEPATTENPCPSAPDVSIKVGAFADWAAGKLSVSVNLFAFHFPLDGSRNFMTQSIGVGLKHTSVFGIPLGVGIDRESHDGGLSFDNYSWSGTSGSFSASDRGVSFDIGLGIGISVSHLENLANLILSCAQ